MSVCIAISSTGCYISTPCYGCSSLSYGGICGRVKGRLDISCFPTGNCLLKLN